MNRSIPIIAAALAITGCPLGAYANPLTAAQILASYNLVTTGDANTNADIEGSAVVGGNASLATMFGNNAPAHPTLDVYGTIQGNLNVNNGGSVHYGAKSASINLNGGSTAVQGGFTNTLLDFTAPLNALSASLAGLAANSAMSNTGTFVAHPDSNGVAVFNLTAAALQTAMTNNSFAFTQNGATAIIVNVDGNYTEGSSTNWNPPPVQQDVIFNFFDATSVAVGNWQSSILAPGAAVSILNGNVQGFVYANSFAGGGELHNFDFTGVLPSVVPEPGTFAMFGLALSGLLTVRRRRV